MHLIYPTLPVALMGALLLGSCAEKVATATVAQTPAATEAPQQTATPATAHALAFPGAEGFGKYTTGGRGGEVVVVTNVNDSGEGSLRDAIQKHGPRIIVFNVSGTIPLESPLDINNPDVTIAGQSAPGDGIAIRNFPVSIKADNVIVRYMRFRLGDTHAEEGDALGGTKGKNNIMLDHCSISWATDENASFYHNKNFTMQWCLIAESLNHSVHHKGEHGYGGIWGGEGASFHHNLLASNKSRNPRFSGSSSTPNAPGELVDFRNNVIFNWMINSAYGGEKGRYNLVNNYYKASKATLDSKRGRIVEPYEPYGQFYVTGNYVDGFPDITQNNWAGGVQSDNPEAAKANKPFEVVALPEQSAQEAYAQVLAQAGASYRRDAVDARIVGNVRSGSPTEGSQHNGIIDSQADVGGWPELQSLPAPPDADQDGMPNAWEQAKGLNPNSATDASGYTLDKQYTNIEVYLNSLLETAPALK